MKLATNIFKQSCLEFPVEREGENQANKSQFFSILNKIWWRVATAFATRNELQVWQRRDRDGNTEWHAYDPLTGHSVCAASDAEMRSWIEQSYYQ